MRTDANWRAISRSLAPWRFTRQDAPMTATTEKSSTGLDWALFILLGFFWGSSYLFIKIGVDEGLEPFTLVSLRLLFGLALLAAVVRVAREPLPRESRMLGHLAVLGFFSVALPFGLITWAEQSVDSSLAAVLTGAVPLFVIPFAALLLPAEKVTINKLLGIGIGLIGVAIVVGFDPAALAGNELIAEVALIGAAASYAIGGVYARRNVHGLRPMIPALFQVGIALVMMSIPAVLLERPWERGITPEAWFAVVWLGLLGSGAAYLIFFRLLGHWGATRTSLVAYLLPIWGIALGALVLQEPIDARLLLGTALVIGGIALVNMRRGSRQLWGRPATPPAPTQV
jgi:drug/metabolite transporter (DMT)-like permease